MNGNDDLIVKLNMHKKLVWEIFNTYDFIMITNWDNNDFNEFPQAELHYIQNHGMELFADVRNQKYLY